MTNGRLLWVDDEIDLLKAHRLFLEKKGYELATCSNGSDAVDLCRENNFDLILLDENMPGLSGLETLARIKEIAPNTPVVMVTKNEEEDLMDQAIGSKIADYLIKPVNPNQILLTLKKNIHQREIVAEVTQSGYRQDFGRIGMQISDSLTPDEWIELYKKLVYWELELSSTDGAMQDMLRMQKEEANLAFARFVRREYEGWLARPDERPMLSPDVFKVKDEKRSLFPVSSFFASQTFGSPKNFLTGENLFQIQSSVILEIAEKEAAIIIGRCADYILRDRGCTLDVFITAPHEARIERICERTGASREKAGEMIEKTDRKRETYYNYYTFGNWGVASNYDLCIDSSILGIEGTADYIIDFARRAGMLPEEEK